jgi:hypothetical protein
MALTSFRSIVLAAAAASMTLSTTQALSSYLTKIPNGDSFSQELGHPDNDSSQYTDFATAFSDAGYTWSAELCAATFPGSTMTNGQAFGDPCCTWAVGGTPDFTVTAFTTSPTEATTCASSTSTASSAATSTASSAATETTEAPATETTEAPATETEAPATETTEAPATETTEAPATETTEAPATETTEAPAAETTTTAPSTSGGCKAKTPSSYSFRH